MAAVFSRRALPGSLLLFSLCLLISGTALRAEPYLAVRYGYKCSQCHLNPTGGGKRNAFGNIFTQTELPRRVLSREDLDRWLRIRPVPPGEDGDESGGDEEGATSPSKGAGSLFYPGKVAEFLSLGGDLRIANLSIIRGSDDASNSFDLTEGNLYASLEFLDENLVLYLDETLAPGGASAREAFVLLRGPWSSYVKAGRMMLPYGLRIQDDQAFIREITGFNYGVQDLGVELGLEPGPLSVSVAVSNGTQGSTDDNRDKQVSSVFTFVQRHWRLGAQATWNNTPSAKRIAAGVHAGVNLGRFSLLGEIDHIDDEIDVGPGEETERKLIAYGAVNYHLTRGVNLKLAYDYLDPDLSESSDSIVRVSAGVEYFMTQFTQWRAFYRFRDETEGSPRDDQSEVLLEFHLFF